MRAGDSRLRIFAFLGATALVLIALVVLARYPSLLRRGPHYSAVFRSVPGLNLGDDVRYGGYLVGTITAMALDSADPTRIRVTFRVGRGTPVRADTRASVAQLGLLGQPYLNLRPGARDAASVPSGSTLSSEESLTFPDAMTRLGAFLDRADSLLQSAERVTKGGPWNRVDQTLARIDTVVLRAGAGSDRALRQLDLAGARLAQVLDRSDRFVASMDTSMREARPTLASTHREALTSLRDLRALVADLRDAVERGDRLDEIMRNVAAASENLNRFTERLDRNPTSVLSRPQPPHKPAGPRP